MQHTFQTASITHQAALRAIQLGIDKGAERGLAVCVTVVDPALAVVAMARADGTTPHSVQTSLRKANTAASTRRPTGWMEGDFALALPLGTDNLLTNIKGGVPVIFEGQVVAGLGVAGGPPDVDAEIALATLSALGAEQPGA